MVRHVYAMTDWAVQRAFYPSQRFSEASRESTTMTSVRRHRDPDWNNRQRTILYDVVRPCATKDDIRWSNHHVMRPAWRRWPRYLINATRRPLCAPCDTSDFWPASSPEMNPYGAAFLKTDGSTGLRVLPPHTLCGIGGGDGLI